MLNKNRLLPIKINRRFIGVITFFVDDESKAEKYIQRESWSIINDNFLGNTIFLDHCITNGDIENAKYSLQIYRDLKNYFRRNFKNIKQIRWNRWKNDRLTVYKEDLNGKIYITREGERK